MGEVLPKWAFYHLH